MSDEKKPRQMPKGGRKGGAIFPRVALKDAVEYARKLVGKTHVSPQPRDVIFSGVVGAKSGIGNVRISALKQYGFLTGDEKVNYSASTLAKEVNSAPPEEIIALYRTACLKPVIFKKLFDTFHGDAVTKGKLRQRAADLKVHPEETEACVDLYVASLLEARLVKVEGDRYVHLSSALLVDDAVNPAAGDQEQSDVAEADPSEELVTGASEDHVESRDAGNGLAKSSAPKAVFNVNVTLDSSLDIEKLQKQLELLKRYGAI